MADYTISGTASYSSTGIANVYALVRNVTQGIYKTPVLTDSSGNYSVTLADGTYANSDVIWVIFYNDSYYKVETGTVDTSGSSTDIDATILPISLSRSSISTNVWDLFRLILSQDPTVKSTLSAAVYGSYPDKFISDEGGLPFVTVHKPTIIETYLTMRKKRYGITFEIECKTNTAATLKSLSEAVRYAFEAARPALVEQRIANMTVTGDDESIDKRREEKTVHTSTMIFEAEWLGGGEIPLRAWS